MACDISDSSLPELYDAPELRSNLSTDAPCHCEIRSTLDKGRCLYMTQSAKPGDMILAELPAACIPHLSDTHGVDQAKQPGLYACLEALVKGPECQLEAVISHHHPMSLEHPAYAVHADALDAGVAWVRGTEAGASLDDASLRKLMLSVILNGYRSELCTVLYLFLSMANHSCQPSAVMVIDKSVSAQCTVRALVELKKGEEVTFSYLHDVMMPLNERANELMKRWFFSNVTPLPSDKFIDAYVKEGPEVEAALATIVEANGFAKKAWELGHSSSDRVERSRHLKNALGAYQLVLKSASVVLHPEHGWVLNAQRRMASILITEHKQFPGTAQVALKLCSTIAAVEEKTYTLGRVKLIETHSMAAAAAELAGDSVAESLWKAKVVQGNAIHNPTSV